MNRHVFLISFLLMAICGAGYAEPAAADAERSLSVRTFQFKHKEADKAAAIIKTLMSAEGSLSIQPSTNSLVVTDAAENLKAITAALARFDAPAQPVHLSVRILTAARAGAGEARVPDDLKDLAPKLAMLRYNSFESLGVAEVVGREGDPGTVNMESGYRADFRFGEYDPAADSIRIKDFKLSRLRESELSQVLKTTLNLKLGQTLILGATRDPQSGRALIVVVTAKR